MDAPARALVAPRAVWRGQPSPLGATWDGSGVNFALYSEHAERVELCLFDGRGRREIERIALRERTESVWHCYLPEVRPGQLYAYRVDGPHAPERGHRYSAHRTLLDPYACLMVGALSSGVGRCQVVDRAFSWGDDRPPRIPWEDTVIYEAHVKGLTRLHPDVPEPVRGTYAGLASPALIEHLRRLGVTAVELLPVHAHVDEKHLLDHGLRNYWGYSSIGFFSPDMRYSATGTLGEFKSMVKTLHAAGIEVLLDVVYNHTGEGGAHGPTLSFKGIDNAVYYRLDDADRRRYIDFTGTGNTLNLGHPEVLRLVMDSLRYWVTEMHVDGFRFDLAAALGRDGYAYSERNAFLAAVHQDPVLSQVKLIAEPWDLGEGGYQLGRFPPRWSEWNDKYRDAARAYWKGDAGVLGELASRIAGSRELFAHNGRGPRASINFVTAHDGFTLQDLVSYDHKHNEANHESNRDGSSHNRSWNHGVEGPTRDEAIVALRERQKRNFLALLLFSRGVPMLLAGDELGRTQLGNNNAYCHDNELSWLDWSLGRGERALIGFVRQAIAWRRRIAALRPRRYDERIRWLRPQGGDMTPEDWALPFARCVGALFERPAPGEEEPLLLLNAHDGPIDFALPEGQWTLGLTTDESFADEKKKEELLSERHYRLGSRSLALLLRPRTSGPSPSDG